MGGGYLWPWCVCSSSSSSCAACCSGTPDATAPWNSGLGLCCKAQAGRGRGGDFLGGSHSKLCELASSWPCSARWACQGGINANLKSKSQLPSGAQACGKGMTSRSSGCVADIVPPLGLLCLPAASSKTTTGRSFTNSPRAYEGKRWFWRDNKPRATWDSSARHPASPRRLCLHLLRQPSQAR